MISHSVTLSCDVCRRTIATAVVARQAYDLAAGIGAVVRGENIFCAGCAAVSTRPIRARRSDLTIDDLLAQTEPDGDCLIWTRNKLPNGRGRVRHAGRDQLAYRVMWELTVGPIQAGLEIDHLCARPECINPDHLEPVTRAENMRRRAERKTSCIHGHDWTDINNISVGANGIRSCKVCKRLKNAASYAARRSEVA